jgi:hypothetical protein
MICLMDLHEHIIYMFKIVGALKTNTVLKLYVWEHYLTDYYY